MSSEAKTENTENVPEEDQKNKEDASKEQPEEQKEKKENEEGPQVEEIPKKEEPQPKQEEPERPKEPEPKIPSDFTSDIEQLTKLKQEGNDLINKDLDNAIIKYDEAYKLVETVISKAGKERDYNEQVKQIDTLRKQIISNLALSYLKKEEYQKCIDLDIKLYSIDSKYDKIYPRLYKCYKAIGNINHALYYGKFLNKNFFDEQTLEKYKDVIPLIEADQKEEDRKINEQKAKERKELIKKIAKIVVPILVLVGAGLAYYFFIYKKKQLK